MIRLTIDGVEVTLTDELVWQCQRKDLEELLQTVFLPEAITGYAPDQAHALVALLKEAGGDRVQILEANPPAGSADHEPDRIY